MNAKRARNVDLYNELGDAIIPENTRCNLACKWRVISNVIANDRRKKSHTIQTQWKVMRRHSGMLRRLRGIIFTLNTPFQLQVSSCSFVKSTQPFT